SITNEAAAPAIQNAERPLHRRARKNRGSGSVVDKSVLALSAPRRIRDRDHVKSVAKLPCLICGRRPADAHHLRFAQSPALGRKVSDEFTVALCRGHHREVHRCGDEARAWPSVLARVRRGSLQIFTKTTPCKVDLAAYRPICGLDCPV